jgi:hypothetical protein
VNKSLVARKMNLWLANPGTFLEGDWLFYGREGSGYQILYTTYYDTGY